MADINNFVFTGRLCADAQFRTLATGKGILNMNVAVNSGYGEYKRTLFIKVQQWGDSGKNIQPFLKKGVLIGGAGELSRNEWQSNTTGETHVDFVVDVRSVQLLSSVNSSSGNEQSAPPPTEEETVF